MTRKPTVIPEGSSQMPVGPFQLFVGPDKLKHESAAVKALEAVDREFKAAGLPLRGRINVVLAGMVRRSYFSHLEGIIRLAVTNLNKDGVETLVHESTHWQHAYHLPSGYGNRSITDKYAEAMRMKVAPGSGSSADRARRELDRLKKQMRVLDVQMSKPPEVQKGDILSVEFSRLGGSSFLKVRVLRVLRDGAQVQLVEPDDFTQRLWPDGKVKLTNESLEKALGDNSKDKLRRERAELLEKAKAAHRAFKDADESGDRIDGVFNPWVPTLYSRTEAIEWFADLVMVRVLRPSLLTDEVRDWIKHVW